MNVADHKQTITCRLDDVCKIIQGGRQKFSGKDFVDVGYPAFGAGGHNGDLPTYEFDRPAIILSAIGARCGKCFFPTGKWSSLANTSLFFPDDTKADARFLWYQLNDEHSWHRSGTAQPYIKPSDIKGRIIFLPPLAEQKRIAAILDAADALRTKRREALAQLDALLQSTFLTLFGDPVENPMGMKVVRLADVSTRITDGVHQKPNYTQSGVPFISVKDITTGKLIFDSCKFISPEEHTRYTRRCKPEKYDILYTKVGATYGRPAIVDTDQEFSIYVSVCLIKPRKDLIDPHFLAAAMGTSAIKRQADKRIKGIGVPDLHLDQIQNFLLPLPPLPLQQKFAAIVESIERQKATQRAHLAELDALFAALQHRAFRGEL
jgi:type I restriction enzyme S subunit